MGRLPLKIGRFAAAILSSAAAVPVAQGVEWERIDRPPFSILYREGNRAEALSLASQAPGVIAELERDLGVLAPSAVLVRILQPRRDARMAGDAAGPPHWAVGYVPGSSREVVLRGDLIRAYPFEDLLSLFGHEMTHILLNSLPAGTDGLPLWFQEGVAVSESRRWSFHDVLALGTALLVASPPPLAALEHSFPDDESAARVAYAESFSFVSFLEREHGPAVVRRIVAGLAAGEHFSEAFRRVTGSDVAEVEVAWRERVTLIYRWIPALTSTSVLWLGITLLVLVSRIAKRRRERAIQEAWEREGLG